MLRGDTLNIRAIERDDLEALNAWWNEADIWGEQGSRRHLSSLDETGAWYEILVDKIESNEGRTYAIEDTEGNLLGTIGYGPWDTRDRNCAITLYIGESAKRGRGYGTEACRLLVDYLFSDLGLQKAWLQVISTNARAIACYRKVGFVQEGLLRRHRFAKGQFHDYVFMALLASEFGR